MCDLRDELRSIVCDPAGLGGDEPGARYAMAADLRGTDRQRVPRPRYGRLGQAAGGHHAFAEPDDARERVDHAKAAPRRMRHQQPAIVRAEIEGSVNPRTLSFATLPGRLTRDGTPHWASPVQAT